MGGEDGVFETGQNQDIRSIDATSGGDIDITDGTVLRLTQQDTNQRWMPRCLAATVRW